MFGDDKSLEGDGRPQNLDENKLKKELFPFEAFETSVVDGNEEPILSLKNPWEMEATLTSYPAQMNNTSYDLTSSGAVKALPTAVGYTDVIVSIWSNGTAGGNNLTFTTVSGQTIDGDAASVWKGEGNGVSVFVSDNSNWLVTHYEDSGSNANGNWKKHIEGKVVCDHFANYSDNTTIVGPYTSIANYQPMSFYANNSTASTTSSYQSPSTTGFVIRVSVTSNYFWSAQGTWK